MSYDLLPNDLWRFIGFKLDSADRIRFRAVSKTWNSLLHTRQTPWLILAEAEEEEDEKEQVVTILAEDEKEQVVIPRRGFVSLGEARIHEIDFPQLHKARVVGSTGNWVITIHLDKTVRLLNPFSRHEIYLPSSPSLEYGAYTDRGDDITLEDYRDNFVWKIVLSSPPCQHNCIAVALHDCMCILALARPGDKSWTLFQTPYTPKMRNLFILDAIFYNHQFYAIDKYGKLIVCHIGHGSEDPPKLSYLNDGIQINSKYPNIYLVEWSGELLLVIRSVHNFEDPDDYKTIGFQLYKLDSENNKWNEFNNLGEHSLFLGFNTSVSVVASDYFDGSVRRNCIYFTDDYARGFRGYCIPGGRDMGVFHLEDNSITPHYTGLSTSLYSPPVWIIPS